MTVPPGAFSPALQPRRVPTRASRPRGPVTLGLVVSNIVVWLAILATGWQKSPLASSLALSRRGRCEVAGDPSRWYPDAGESACAAVQGHWVPGFLDGAWWQPVTSAFSHVELVHLGFNMVALWMLGPTLEQALGKARYLAIYAASALLGSAAVLLLSPPQASTLGASGAIMGLLGALLVLAWWRGGDVRTILFWLAANAVITLGGVGAISWQGHLGGFVGGFLTTLLLLVVGKVPRRGSRPTSLRPRKRA